MATAHQSDDETASESDLSDESGSDEESDEDTDCQPCKYYNKSRCRDGDRCPYLHVCKFYLEGNCRYGSACRLKHSRGGGKDLSASSCSVDQSTPRADPKLTNGQYYQWQFDDGGGWKDVANDHIIEAQYCLPHTKSIKLYNTPHGAVSIDFNRMRVYRKSLSVRRLDDGNTVWIWYCTVRRKWIKYGDMDSKGNPSPVKSADIESKFQTNPTSVFTFSIGGDTFEIRFREMRQVSKNKKRKVTRRPLYKQQQAGAGVSQLTSAVQNFSLGTTPQWQFEGDSGRWHHFKHRRGTSTECSVTSDDIERKYQENPQSIMTFNVKGHTYKLDLGAMTQTNLKTQHTRKIRRL
uniref:Uncharacterized protein n=1 Tax=Monopterus albus TaxID=43700 RepID=A0A3Q3JCA2_MONAL|nr:zinc finger CCCH-type antiviral protein 1-like isoform X1 [Monopterus albus]XP_020455266.1 zinc finger CCCH-type antiviral protein 1-like isoform X1 [Monopterus albus]